MENNNERDYSQQGSNPQEQNNSSTALDHAEGSGNLQRNEEDDHGGAGYDSGTNPERDNSMSGGAEASSPVDNYTERERYSAGNSDFDERKDTTAENLEIPDSDDLEDEDDFNTDEALDTKDDFGEEEENIEGDPDELEEDAGYSNKETRTSGF